MTKKLKRKKYPITREVLARVIYRTMRIEEPSVTWDMARKAARKIRLPKT